MKKRLIYISILFLLTPLFVGAADLYFDVVPKEAKVGDVVVATLFMDAEGEVLNALEGSVSYSSELEVSQVRTGDSFITFWIQQPEVRGDSIFYAGIVPGGYQGNVSPKWKGFAPGKVFTLVFKAKKEGDAWIQINRESVVLLHDGKGTEASLTLRDVKLPIRASEKKEEKDVSSDTDISWNDTVPPESFIPVIIRNPDTLFGGKYYAIFETADKQSGIDHYEVQEGTGGFVIAESPYLLKRQGREVVIMIKAVDKAGNERVETIQPTMELLWYEKTSVRVGALLSVLLCIALAIILSMYRRKKKLIL